MKGMAITKIAINNTMGTEDFQPLDEMLRSHNTLRSSTAKYKKICDSWVSTSGSDTKTFTARTSGTIGFSGNIKSATGLVGYIKVNDTSIVAKRGGMNFLYYDFPITAGKEYTITLKYGTVTDFWITAELIDNWWIQID